MPHACSRRRCVSSRNSTAMSPRWPNASTPRSRQPDISTFALSQIIEPMRDQFSVIAATRGLQLRVVPTRLVVRSDAQLLRRIVQNFVSNALRYTRQGGVLLGVRRYGGEASVEVW